MKSELNQTFAVADVSKIKPDKWSHKWYHEYFCNHVIIFVSDVTSALPGPLWWESTSHRWFLVTTIHVLHLWSKFGDPSLNGSRVIVRATRTDAGNDNTQRPKLASGNKWDILCGNIYLRDNWASTQLAKPTHFVLLEVTGKSLFHKHFNKVQIAIVIEIMKRHKTKDIPYIILIFTE